MNDQHPPETPPWESEEPTTDNDDADRMNWLLAALGLICLIGITIYNAFTNLS